ncbi:MAG: hypothetical protein MUF00_02370 [Gemmatimonadaceae bacterium]|jgi:hypothetical protein|nr:hypothetical protein [Gemmatimonadaceae bacterium]
MELHQRQQFDLLLSMAVDRFAERLEQRNEGAERAQARLAADPEGEGIWLTEFTQAVFRDALLDNADGAAWVLAALAARPFPAALLTRLGTAARVGDAASVLAQGAFAALLRDRTDEELTRRATYGAHLLANQT